MKLINKNNFKLSVIFVLSFILNLIWENFHSKLYTHYQGGPITEIILLRAALVDALIITAIAIIFIKIDYFKQNLWWTIIIGVIIAIGIELYALSTDRWTYNEMMPIIPIINTGLTPTIQLGLLSYLTFKIAKLQNSS
ncbi:hypothetical protein HYZ76_02425 [Candidatus Falkowbacteria bacterium]|nr:hypothetical protein [Candidatus Falkowbacteria bacterium]